MLCDDIILGADPANWNRPFGLKQPKGPLKEWLVRAAGLVRQAQRFDISNEALHVAVQVSNSKPSSLMSGLGICRLPFKSIFIEYDWDARLKLLTDEWGYVDQREDKNVKMRYGLLATATDDTFRRGTLHLFTKYDRYTPTMSPLLLDFDFSALDENLVWQRHIQHNSTYTIEDVRRLAAERDPADYSPRFVKHPEEQKAMAEMNNIFDLRYDPEAKAHVEYLGEIGGRTHGVEQINRYVRNWHINMTGEARFFLSLLMLLNSRNLAQIEEVTIREKNRERSVRGSRAVVSHNRVRIQLTRVSRRRMESQGITESGEIAYHLVRGHWKVRKTGVFFWRPHMAGNPEKGTIIKDYTVEV